jgi:hypothetical protein
VLGWWRGAGAAPRSSRRAPQPIALEPSRLHGPSGLFRKEGRTAKPDPGTSHRVWV